MSRLIKRSWEQVEAEVLSLHRDAKRYPSGSKRREDLIRDAIALVREWQADQPKPSDSEADES